MRLDLQLTPQLRQELRLKLAPQIIQSIEILQLPIADLQDLIREELEENPTIEISPPEVETDESPASAPETTADETATPGEEMLRQLEVYDQEWLEQYRGRRSRGGSSEDGDRKLEAMQNAPSRPETLQEHLLAQLAMMDFDEKHRRIAEQIIYNIGADGFLQSNIEEIVDAINQQSRKQAEEFLAAVRRDLPVRGATEDLRRLLLQRLSPADADYRLREIIVYNLHPDGALGRPLDEVLAPLLTSVEEAREVLSGIHRMDPIGVGSRDTRECLLLQLDEDDPHLEAKQRLIKNHLDNLAQNRLPRIVKEMAISIEELNELILEISHLRPRPGAGFNSASVPYVVPDVVVELVDGRYEVRVEDSYLPRLCVSNEYRAMLNDKNTGEQALDFVRKKIESARRLIGSIEQRQSTLQNVAQCISEYQRPFLEHGIQHMRPLKMQEIADRCGIHVSTVSRAISDKYIQTPGGIFPLKFFFSGAAETDGPEETSRHGLLNILRGIVAGEDKSRPLSDCDIEKELRKRGINLARRTVVKYRDMLGIPSSRRRKKY